MIQGGIDVSENMLQLWQQNKGFIARLAMKYTDCEDIEDLKQQGYIGLCNAVDGYRETEGTPFINYAAFWIKCSMRRYIAECGCIVRVPEEARHIPYCDEYYIVPFYRSPFATQNFRSYKELRKLIEENEYELVHCHTPVAAAIARYAFRTARKKHNTKVLYTAHGFHFYKGAPKISRLYYSVEKAMIRYTDGIITINEEDYLAAKKMCRNKKCDAYKISGIGIDLSRVRNSTRTREDIRDEFGIPHDAFLVMSNSEINENKNVECSITAVAANKGVYMLICGSGKSMEKCRELVKELGCTDRIIFAGYRYDAKELLHGADAFIFLSCREGLGLAAIEAMGAGLPLIVSDNRGTREYAVNGENSIVCECNNVSQFIKAVHLLSSDDELCKKLGRNGYSCADKYAIENSLAEMAEIYGKYVDIPTLKTETEVLSGENR